MDDLVDVIEGSRVYIPCIYVINKIDQARQPLFSCAVFERQSTCSILVLHALFRQPHGYPLCIHDVNKIERCAANPLERRSLEI